MPDKVSILIPTYNRANYLRQAVKSALAQTYTNIKILVLDDASPDDTPAVAAEFRSDSRVRYIRHSSNRGIAGNWREGIQAASGDYFCILHDDDTFEPDFVQTLVQPLEEDRSLVLSFCDHWVMNEDGQRQEEGSFNMSAYFKRDTLPEGHLRDFARSALVDLNIPVGATMFRRSLVTPDAITEEAKGSIDIWLLYQCVKTQHGAYYIPKRLMNYRAHGAGMSANMPVYMLEGHLFRYRKILADGQMAALHSLVRKQIAGTLTKLGITVLRQGHQHEARQYLREAFRHGMSSRNIVTYLLSCSGTLGTRAALALRRY